MLVIAVASVACGDDDSDGDAAPADRAPEVYAELVGSSGRVTPELVERAEEEGELDIYTSNSDLEELIGQFEDTYDVTVSVYRATSETVLQRLLQEDDAGYHGSDVVETNAFEMEVLGQEGLLAPYEGKVRDGIRAEGRFDRWTASRFTAFVVAWNTEQVPEGEEPRRWEDLADARWEGKLSMEFSDFDWYLTLHRYLQEEGRTAGEVNDLFERIAGNARLVRGHTAQGELLSAGEFGLAASAYSHTVDQAAAEGAPVTWKPAVEPAILRASGVGLMRTADHPAAAVLFYEWLLTEGQKALVELIRLPSATSVEGNPLEDLDVIGVDVSTLVTDSATWSKRYERLVGEGSAS